MEERKDLEVLWDVPRLAEYLGVSTITVYHWLSKKKVIDPEKVVRLGRSVRIPRSEVERIAGTIKNKLKG